MASPPRIFTSRWQVAAIWSGFALLVAGLLAALLLAAHTETIRAKARAHLDIETAARDLFTALLDSETAQRGYLLTGDDSYLAPSFSARVDVQTAYRVLERQAASDATQARRVEALGPLIGAKLSELETTTDLARRGQRDAAIKIVSGASGRDFMAALRSRIALIQASAATDLATARRQLDNGTRLLQAVISTTILLGFLLIGVIARARTQMLASLTEQNLQLEERVRERTAALEARNKRIETLIQDVSHRVGNSLSLVTGFLDLQARASKSDEVKGALAAARQRVFSIASAQRRMRLAMDADTVDAAPFFGALIDDFRAALPDKRIAISSEVADISLSSQDASAFGVILNELLANAVKHAWLPNEEGAVRVSFARAGDEHVLRVEDDGRGLGAREDSSGGLGRILVESLVQSIEGALTTTPLRADAQRPGLICTVRAGMD